MSNLLKRGTTFISEERIIDYNELIKLKLKNIVSDKESHSNVDADGFVNGLKADVVEQLLTGSEDENEAVDSQNPDDVKNQLAAASANTGGYNNSYAQQSAQQAYNNTMNGLSDKAIELRANALTNWQNEYNQIQDRYNLVNNQKAAEESSYYNKLNAANNAYTEPG